MLPGCIASAPGGQSQVRSPAGGLRVLQVLLPTPTGPAGLEVLDAKVIALSEWHGARTVVARFTGLDWDTQGRIEGFAHRD